MRGLLGIVHLEISFTLAELEAEAAGGWQEIQNDPGQLEAFAHALNTTRTHQRGERPETTTPRQQNAPYVALCGCGKVHMTRCRVARGAMNSGPVPRPGPVLCRDCGYWIPDTINPLGGLGKCEKNVTGLAWPTRQLSCDHYQEMA